LTGCERHDYDASAAAANFRGADDRFLSVIASFDDHIRLEKLDQLERSVFAEDDDEIDGFNARQHVRPLGLSSNGSSGTLETAHREIAVDPDDECIRRLARGQQKVDMPGMKEIEHTVRKRYPVLSGGSPPAGLGPRCNLGRRNPWLQGPLSPEG
jgi:hypothetical protein